MNILAQSQAPAKVSYIHLAYLSASLSKPIVWGSSSPTVIIGAGLLGATLIITLRNRLKKNWERQAVVGMAIAIALGAVALSLWMGNNRLERVIKGGEYWAMRDADIRAEIQAAAQTNAAAAELAMDYYSLKHGGEDDALNKTLAIRYLEQLRKLGSKRRARLVETEIECLDTMKKIRWLEEGLASGKLSATEATWAKQRRDELQNVVDNALNRTEQNPASAEGTEWLFWAEYQLDQAEHGGKAEKAWATQLSTRLAAIKATPAYQKAQRDAEEKDRQRAVETVAKIQVGMTWSQISDMVRNLRKADYKSAADDYEGEISKRYYIAMSFEPGGPQVGQMRLKAPPVLKEREMPAK